jgi:serine/threonine protein kinase
VSGRTLINSRYELEKLPIARGGMGEVWVGRDIKLEREIAVKFVRFPDDTPDPDLIRRFVRESRITARLEHPGVPAVYDVGTYDGRPFLVMQRVRGISVADLIAEQGQLPIGWAAAIAAQTCSVLSVAHQASLVHRDLKPSNLMLESEGSVKVLDFGLAVALDRADFSTITSNGQTLGTPAYMAPEQILAGMSGPASDLYALGCTLYEMLCGQPVFAGSTAYTLMNMQVDERPRAVRGIRPEVPAELERLVFDLLEKKPGDRPANADAVYQRLMAFATGLEPLPGVLRPPSVPSPVRMYASVLSRVFSGIAGPGPKPEQEPAPSSPPKPAAEPGPAPLHRSELDRARNEASRLVKQSRYSQAADVLATVVEQANRSPGEVDDDVVSIRLELANVLFEGGDYHRAASEYQQLAAELAARHGPDAEPVLNCRLKEATCHALVGETKLALRQLGDLLLDERRIFGADDPRTLDLRRQIGLLQLGAGQRQAAERTLTQLLADLKRQHSPDNPAVKGTADLLTGLRRSGYR